MVYNVSVVAFCYNCYKVGKMVKEIELFGSFYLDFVIIICCVFVCFSWPRTVTEGLVRGKLLARFKRGRCVQTLLLEKAMAVTRGYIDIDTVRSMSR